MTWNGIDVSNNNSAVDWQGVEFAFYKATEGASFIDTTQHAWANHVKPSGPYHFAHPDANTPQAEADHFLKWAVPGQMWALDCETRPGVDPLHIMGATRLAAWCDEFYGLVAPHLGPNGYHYTFRSYAEALWPLLTAPWRWWLASAAGVPSYRSYAGRTVDIEQFAQTGGIDRDIAYTALVAQPDQEIEVPAPAVAHNPITSQDEEYVRGVDGQLWGRTDTTDWAPFGGQLTSGPSVSIRADGSVSVVARGVDGATWKLMRDASGHWGAWFTLGGKS
jgi:hypothetical protein